MRFGDNLRSFRLKMGWTQQQLASMVGRSKNNISQYERNKREPDIAMLIRFARLLNASTDELLDNARQTAMEKVAVYDRYPLTNPVALRNIPGHNAPPRAHFYFIAQEDHDWDAYGIRAGALLLIHADASILPGHIHLLVCDNQATLRLIQQADADNLLLWRARDAEPEKSPKNRVHSLGVVLCAEMASLVDV